MRPHTLIFRLTAATAVTTLMLGQAVPQPALAQPAPPTSAPAAADQQTADPPIRAGWLSQISGTVSFHAQDQDQWSPASMNYPVATGDSFWTEPNATARITISSSRIALAGGTEVDVGTLDPSGLQATLPQGEIYLRLRDLAPNETWSMQTPRGLATFSGAGRYGVVAGDTQNPTTVTVLEGSVQVTGPGLTLQVGQGQTATITGGDTFQGNVGPAELDAFLTAMQQAEQPARTPAAPPPAVVAQIPGGDDLSAYGSWSQTPDYGQVWYPQVAAGWAPYRDGHWAYIAPWGWTWVDDAPWGFAPFHYGRWFEHDGRWGWTPGVEAYDGPPVYAPALVAFVGLGVGIGIGAALASGSVGWVPLGPREPFHPWYHASDRYFRTVNRRDVTNITVINNRNVTFNNFANRRAMTVVPASALAASRPVRQVAEHVDPRMLSRARPVIGREPIRPTAATAGVTPGLAQRMHLPPGPAGIREAAHVAPGPAIHAGPSTHGAAARPALRPAGQPGAASEHGAPTPSGFAQPAGPGGRAGRVATPGAEPALRRPGERSGGAPGSPVTRGERPDGAVSPGANGGRPGEVAAPGGTPALRTPAEHDRRAPGMPVTAGTGTQPPGKASPGTLGGRPGGFAAPGGAPALRTPADHEGRAPGMPVTGAEPPDNASPGAPAGRPGGFAAPKGAPALRTPAERAGATPPPIEHRGAGTANTLHEAAPRGAFRPRAPEGGSEHQAVSPIEAGRPAGAQVVRPGLAEHGPELRPATPATELHGAPIPGPRLPTGPHVAPMPQVHAPAPISHAPAPVMHAPAPAMHAPAPQMHVAPRPAPQMHAPPPQMHVAPRPAPQFHPAPAPHPAPQFHPAPAPHPAPAAHSAPAHQEKKK